ncbi:POU domain, class 6, transcription factor 2-like isoform X2 [Penaeus chinensis]|uniref:POU domain, class 6, transcription factor 2-like isoform X2 n=1 Tax=Penaeus chinensis TaxID=139456 RepID=UPI001FB6CC8B|nr:POU domain, class 6, transcription factor 2-like isoform X2 [Penaeus chinensis]
MIMQLAGDSDIGPLALDREEEDYKEISHSDTSINVARWATFRDSEGRRDSEYSDVPDDQRPPLHISLAGGVSPPPSPPTAASPAPTMAPGHGGSSPVSGLATLHHALHGLHNLHNLHNLQNFHNLQQNLQTQMAALAGLQGGLGVPGVGSLLHPPLAPQQHPAPAAPSPAGMSPAPPPANGNNASAVPQMVLTSGHVTQGVQGAQLLIPTSQGIAVQPILTIPLGQAGVQGSSSLVNPLVPLHHLQHQGPHPQHTGSATSSPLPPNSSSNSSSSSSSSSASAAPHPLLGLAGLPPSLFHAHHAHNNNNNNSNNNNNNNMGTPDKPKLPLSLSSPVTADAVGALGARMGTHYPAPPPPPPTARYSPDFLDNHTGSTGGPPYWQLDLRMAPSLKNPGCITDDDDQPTISQSTGNLVDGVNLDEIKEFAKAFKIRRLSMGLTQTQVGQALSITEGPAYSQSAICRFEKLDITPKSAQKIKPVLERWMQEAEDRYKNGQHTLTEFMGTEPSKKRKRRTSFTPQALEVLNGHFERNTHPSGAEITALAEQLGYEREVVRIWFCNKRQALKNTVRMMAKSSPTAPPPPPPPHPTLN